MKTTLNFLLLIVITAVAACSSNSISVIIESLQADTAHYTIDRIHILSSDSQPGAGKITVRIVYTLHQTGGTVSPVISLYDDDSFFRGGDDDVDRKNFVEGTASATPGTYDGIIEFDLSCDDDEVVGRLGGTREGHSDIFGVNEAEIKAAARRQGENQTVVVSDSVNFWCED